MPAETPKSTTTEAKPTKEKFSKEAQKAISKASGSLWKKVLYWGLGILGAIGAVIGLVYLFKGEGNGPIEGTRKQVKQTKQHIARSDLEAKLAVAKHEAKETETREKLKEIEEMDDEWKAMEELNSLIEPDAPTNS